MASCVTAVLCNFVYLSLLFLLSCVPDIDCSQLEHQYVSCGSALKLFNYRSNTRLHSHDVKYGSGSGQQSVTAVVGSDDHNSYWRVRGKIGVNCVRGAPVKCGQTIRLTHLNTGRNLHSHQFRSPLSNNLEVSAFGESGVGDEGDHWAVICSGQYWRRDDRIRLKHSVTQHYLHVNGDTYGRPIHGQKEVSGYNSPNEYNFWQAAEGIFIRPNENSFFNHGIAHDEL